MSIGAHVRKSNGQQGGEIDLFVLFTGAVGGAWCEEGVEQVEREVHRMKEQSRRESQNSVQKGYILFFIVDLRAADAYSKDSTELGGMVGGGQQRNEMIQTFVHIPHIDLRNGGEGHGIRHQYRRLPRRIQSCPIH